MLQFQPLEAEVERFAAEVIPRVRALALAPPDRRADRQETTMTSSAAPRPVAELWYTRCPVPTASSLAIAQGWLDDEFAADGITVALAARERRPTGSRVALRPHAAGLVPPGRQHPADLDPLARQRRAADRPLVGRAVPVDRRAPGAGIDRSRGPEGQAARAGPPRQRPDRLLAGDGAARLRQPCCVTSGCSLDDVELVDLPVDELLPAARATSRAQRLAVRRLHQPAPAVGRGAGADARRGRRDLRRRRPRPGPRGAGRRRGRLRHHRHPDRRRWRSTTSRRRR